MTSKRFQITEIVSTTEMTQETTVDDSNDDDIAWTSLADVDNWVFMYAKISLFV